MAEKSTTSTKNKAKLTIKQAELKIGKCTYIINTSFNGDKNRSLGASLMRVVSRDASNANDIPHITA